jgi:hypothetical protein
MGWVKPALLGGSLRGLPDLLLCSVLLKPREHWVQLFMKQDDFLIASEQKGVFERLAVP